MGVSQLGPGKGKWLNGGESSPHRDQKFREHLKGREETAEARRGDTLPPLRRHSDPREETVRYGLRDRSGQSVSIKMRAPDWPEWSRSWSVRQTSRPRLPTGLRIPESPSVPIPLHSPRSRIPLGVESGSGTCQIGL